MAVGRTIVRVGLVFDTDSRSFSGPDSTKLDEADKDRDHVVVRDTRDAQMQKPSTYYSPRKSDLPLPGQPARVKHDFEALGLLSFFFLLFGFQKAPGLFSSFFDSITRRTIYCSIKALKKGEPYKK